MAWTSSVVTAPARGASRTTHLSFDVSNPAGSALGGAWKREGVSRGGARNNEYFWDMPEAGGYSKQEGYKGVLCNNCAGTRVGMAAVTPLLTRRPLGAGLVLPDYTQVHQYDFVLSFSGNPALATDAGLFFYTYGGVQPGPMWNGGNMGFALALNAAGGVEWRVRNTVLNGQDIYAETFPLGTFIPDKTEWWKATIRFYHAKPDADATINLLINDRPVLARTVGAAGSIIPIIPATINGIDCYCYRAYIAGHNWASGTGGGIRVSHAQFITGPDDPGTY